MLSHMYPSRAAPTHGIFIHHHARHLLESGCEVLVVSPVPYTPRPLAINQRRKAYLEAPRHDAVDGVSAIYPRYVRAPGKLFHAPAAHAMNAAARRSLREVLHDFNPDLVHAHTATPDGYAGLLLGRWLQLPTVVSLRGSDINVYPFRDRWTLRMTKRVLRQASRLTAVSEALKSAAESIERPSQPIEVVYTGCDLQGFTFDLQARTVLRDQLGISRNDVVLIFIGNVIREKGINELVDAFCTVANADNSLHLVVVGSGKCLGHLIQRAESHGVGDRVHSVGPQAHSDIHQWLSASDVLVLPSWREGLPNVIVEAMACSRPVVATRVGGIPEAVTDRGTGILVDRGDVGALTQAIRQLVSDVVMREKMGREGQRAVEKRFTWQRNAEQTIQLYREVLGER